MPREDQHIDCANRTQKTIGVLLAGDRAEHSPWIATTAFYKALQVVEAVFANDPSIGNSANHDERDQILRTTRKYENIYKHYSPLKRASMNARYLAGCSVFDDYMTPDQVIDKLLKHHLKQVEESSRKFLTDPDKLVSIDSASF